jgi:hypothetical protein
VGFTGTRQARNTPVDVGIFEALDGLHLSSHDPGVEIGAANRPVPHSAEGNEFATADRITDNANRRCRNPCGFHDR